MVPIATTGFTAATLLSSGSARVGPLALGCSVETLFLFYEMRSPTKKSIKVSYKKRYT